VDGASTSLLRVGYIPCGSPGDLISVMGEAPFDRGPCTLDDFFGFGYSRAFRGFF
jgi:hypothetical protein